MRADTLAGYDRDQRRNAEDLYDYPHEYPFCLIKVLAETTDGDENLVATYIQFKPMCERESRLFVERSPPTISWLRRVFNLILETQSLGIVSGGLHEIRIDCEDEIEILEDEPALIDHREEKVYFDDGSAGDAMALEEWEAG